MKKNKKLSIWLLFLVSLSILLLSACDKHSAFTIFDPVNNQKIEVKCQDYYYEEIICTTPDSIYTIYFHYNDQKTFLSEWNMKGELISKFEFPFNHFFFLFRCENIAYDPVQKLLFYKVYRAGVYQYDLKSNVEKVLYSTPKDILGLKIVDKDHIAFIFQFKRNNYLKVINIHTSEIVCSIEFLNDMSCCIGAISHDKQKIIIYGSKTYLVSLKNKTIEMIFKKNANSYITADPTVWSPDDSKIFYVHYDIPVNELIGIDVKNKKVIYEHILSKNMSFANPVFFNNDTLLFSSYDDNLNDSKLKLNMFDIKSKKIINSWPFEHISYISVNPPYIIIGNVP